MPLPPMPGQRETGRLSGGRQAALGIIPEQ